MPDDSGALAVNTRAHSKPLPSRTRLRVHWAPGIPHALFFRGERFMHSSGASRRENAYAYLELAPQKTGSRFGRSFRLRIQASQGVERSASLSRWRKGLLGYADNATLKVGWSAQPPRQTRAA